MNLKKNLNFFTQLLSTTLALLLINLHEPMTSTIGLQSVSNITSQNTYQKLNLKQQGEMLQQYF